MSDVAASAASARSPRLPTLAAAGALGLSVGVLALRLSPTPAPGLALGAVVGLAALTFAALAETAEAAKFAKIFGALAGFCALAAAAADPKRVELAFALGSLALLCGGAWSVRSRLDLGLSRRAAFGLAAALLAALAAFNAYYVIVSQDLMIADYMFYRVVSIAVGTLLRQGNLAALALDLAHSMAQDYSWAPALAPGAALAAFGLLSRSVYQAAILVCYAAPALIALAWGAREIAGGARRDAATFAFALAAVVAAYPFGVVVAARGMPDIGGLALFVLALRLADRLAGALAQPTADERRGAKTRLRAGADAVCDVPVPALVRFRGGGDPAGAGGGSRRRGAAARRGVPLARGGTGGFARRADAVRAARPGARRLAARPRRA